jgi:hypothetical protein
MVTPNPALLPDPPLFDVISIAKKGVEGRIERFALDELELAPNARREISADGFERLAGLLMRAGQLVPCIGYRREPNGPSPSTRASDGTSRPGKATSSPVPKATRA